MKLYDFSLAPSPRRVRMFLVEKGVDIPIVEINTRERAQFSDDLRQDQSVQQRLSRPSNSTTAPVSANPARSAAISRRPTPSRR